MRNFTVTMLLVLSSFLTMNAQNIVKGIVINNDSEKPLQGVSINVKETNISTTTDANGAFTLNGLPDGQQIVVVSFNGFETQNFPVRLSGKTIDIGTVMMYEDISEDQDLSTITITDDELNDDSSSADNISGLLQSSRDVYLRTAAFEWSSSFYRIKGLDSENGKVLINGIEMNKLYNGRPQWSNWGGLNDVLRNQEFSTGLTPSNYTFGGVLGSTNINTRASEYRKGARISYASSNRSYSHRLMATYASGLLENGWAITASGSKRYAEEGFVDGTLYNAHSIFVSLEKQISDKHSLNLTVIQAENRRGKSAPHTQEVYDIKGIKYNSYWGYQAGELRNSRIKRVNEPIIMLNHYWNIGENTTLNTGVAYQFGEIGNSRLDYNGGNNPDPTYYRKLPSYYLSNPNGADFEGAYKALTNFQNNGQINWDDLYFGNEGDKNDARFVLYEDRNDDKQFTANTILNTELTENITLNASLEYRKLKSENFASIIDMLGANFYKDINTFGADLNQQQSNLLTPERFVTKGDRFKYNYNLESNVYGGFAQLQFKYNKVDFYVAGSAYNTSHQRDGLYQNGYFPTNSFGKSKKLDFFNYGAKAGATYKISGRHLLDFNGGYITKAPSIRNSFANSRANNVTVADISSLDSEKIMSFDASYILRTPFITSKLTGYYTDIKDATEISFFFADGLNGDSSAFIQEILTGIDKRHMGVEFGIEAQVTPTIKLRGAANYGQYTYNNNPDIVLTSDNSNFTFDKRKALLKDYKVAAGPQTAYSLGFDYRDPDYWFVGVTANYFDKAYVDVSPLRRTDNFSNDVDGQVFADYDPVLARQLLAQEKFDDYFTLNAIGGKSWKIGNNKFISVFASVSNILGEEYKTGGFEQGRNSNYRELRDDNANGAPTFGNKYWFGRGTTYFLNVNYRF